MRKNDISKITYIQCDKPGYHQGEPLNIVCLNSQCSKQPVFCWACIEQNHKNHNTKPLKMVIKEAENNCIKQQSNNLDIDVLFEIIQNNKKDALQRLQIVKEQLKQQINKTQKIIINFFSFLTQNIKLRTANVKNELSLALKMINQSKSKSQFNQLVIKIINFMANQNNTSEKLDQSQLIKDLNLSQDEIYQSLDKMVYKIADYNKIIGNLHLKSNYKFSNVFKHPDIQVISEIVVRSTNINRYKFAIMEPNLQKGQKIKNFSFKINQSKSGWLAVGMCHKKIVASFEYNFKYTQKHGAYLVSANGGSWSTINSQKNNVVKAFLFKKNDIITCNVNFEINKIVFLKNKIQSYELEFQKIVNDELHPCVLFYYPNDEIQFYQESNK